MTGPSSASSADDAACTTAASPTSADSAPAIAVEHLTHVYPQSRKSDPQNARPALNDLNFRVESGEIFGVLGPNGGGKTTLFRILSTLMTPRSTGADTVINVLGHDIRKQASKVRAWLGVVFQSPSLDIKLTAIENMTHQGHLYGLKGSDLQQRISKWLDYFGLKDRQTEPVELFSGGMRRRVELAKALLHEPRLLLLDEPSSGLDPGARADMWAQLQKLRDAQDQTVVLTTHLMEEADRCDRLAIISKGKLVAVDSPSNLKAQIGGDVITIQPGQSNGDLIQLAQQITEQFGPWDDNAAPKVVENAIHMEKPDGPTFVGELAGKLREQIGQISVGRPTLEDVFLHLTGHMLWQDDK